MIQDLHLQRPGVLHLWTPAPFAQERPSLHSPMVNCWLADAWATNGGVRTFLAQIFGLALLDDCQTLFKDILRGSAVMRAV